MSEIFACSDNYIQQLIEAKNARWKEGGDNMLVTRPAWSSHSSVTKNIHHLGSNQRWERDIGWQLAWRAELDMLAARILSQAPYIASWHAIFDKRCGNFFFFKFEKVLICYRTGGIISVHLNDNDNWYIVVHKLGHGAYYCLTSQRIEGKPCRAIWMVAVRYHSIHHGPQAWVLCLLLSDLAENRGETMDGRGKRAHNPALNVWFKITLINKLCRRVFLQKK